MLSENPKGGKDPRQRRTFLAKEIIAFIDLQL